MAKISIDTQDNEKQFEGALDNLYWQKFFHLRQDERPDAIQAMMNRRILITEQVGNYQVEINIRGINPSARNFEYGPDRTPLYFREKSDASTLIDFCADKGGATLTEY